MLAELPPAVRVETQGKSEPLSKPAFWMMGLAVLHADVAVDTVDDTCEIVDCGGARTTATMDFIVSLWSKIQAWVIEST